MVLVIYYVLCIRLVEQISFQLFSKHRSQSKVVRRVAGGLFQMTRPAIASAVVILGIDSIPAVFSQSQDRVRDINLPDEIRRNLVYCSRLSQIFARQRRCQNFQIVWRHQAETRTQTGSQQ